MRTPFLMNLLLTFVWLALSGNFSLANTLFGFLMSFAIMWIISLNSENRKYFRIAPKTIGFVLFFLAELTKANIQVAIEVMTPKSTMKPGIVRYPLEAKSDFEITLLANLISLTPGTCSLDVSTDRKVLYIHAMYIGDKEKFIRDIQNGFERRLLAILR
ncbi:MAG: Na+/H+ antiporter subunit E [Algoriphagus sp.]|uniref:Na+/H+ antiporter subunit E n=1 Tax=Algoriphagus sp. TaxID=1872435 RepID=UPI00271F670E|nr:Na+/H+ antiporter subunit E [Algoriphagus sp.]MDO8967322.1 Na+/H+ antiporter subunit E [Algoriphagus sp.]MDP2040638.1 Na+/H+ antiporter subunit E [Algoriphagus sp.]MDP3199578.1 Na+/H+ antiporter subunit E [Algoriphagus sp.]MDP3470938.1 Na+/H+ antiporter subunit E [Algoriphagus sp.]